MSPRHENQQILDLSAHLIRLALPGIHPATRLLLSQCEVSISPSRRALLISCADKKIAIGLSNLRSRRLDLIRSVKAPSLENFLGFPIEKISLYLLDREYLSFEIPGNLKVLPTMINLNPENSRIGTDSDRDLLIEALESQYSVTIVRLNDSVCLFSNNEQTKKFTELDPTIYLGTSVANLWIPSEQERLFIYLGRDGQVSSFEYKGYRKIDVMKGIYQPIDLCADFRLVSYMGHRCRIGHFRFA